jgi:hypothetical protein
MLLPRMKLINLITQLRGRKGNPDEGEVRSANLHRYHAVSIATGLMSCPKARKARGIRFLSRLAPSIPLPGCSMSEECSCRFQKHNDRRQVGDRRLFGNQSDERFYSGVERRQPYGRRSADSRPQAG